MFGTFVKYQFQRTYDAILAAPVDTEELVTAETLWIATRAGIYGCVPLIVAIPFGLDPSWGMLFVPVIAWTAGLGWACFGIMVAGFAKSFENFNYIVSAVLTPLFLLAGTFFPLSGLPDGAQVLGELNPLAPVRPARARFRLHGSELGRSRADGSPRRLRARHVADRDPRDGAQADRLTPSLELGAGPNDHQVDEREQDDVLHEPEDHPDGRGRFGWSSSLSSTPAGDELLACLWRAELCRPRMSQPMPIAVTQRT